MNLNEYDNVEEKYNKGTWIIPTYKKLYSKDIEYHPYYTFFKRYNKKFGIYDYYIVLSDEPIPNKESHSVTRNKNNIIKLNLSPLWNTTSLKDIKNKILINIELVEKQDDGVVYYIDI